MPIHGQFQLREFLVQRPHNSIYLLLVLLLSVRLRRFRFIQRLIVKTDLTLGLVYLELVGMRGHVRHTVALL